MIRSRGSCDSFLRMMRAGGEADQEKSNVGIWFRGTELQERWERSDVNHVPLETLLMGEVNGKWGRIERESRHHLASASKIGADVNTKLPWEIQVRHVRKELRWRLWHRLPLEEWLGNVCLQDRKQHLCLGNVLGGHSQLESSDCLLPSSLVQRADQNSTAAVHTQRKFTKDYKRELSALT